MLSWQSLYLSYPILFSIEEDFVTWKEGLWPVIVQYYGLDASHASNQIGREFQLVLHEDLPPKNVYSGEPHKLGSYLNQKPYVVAFIDCVITLFHIAC